MTLSKKIALSITLCLTLVGCDQFTKMLAAEHLPRGQMTSFFFDVLRIGYAENTGAFLGMGDNLDPQLRFWIFVVAVGAMLAGLAIYLALSFKQPLAQITGLTLIFAGGLSNFYDRVINNGAVVDFLNVGFGPVRTGIFNVADMAIMLGFVLVLLAPRIKSVKN